MKLIKNEWLQLLILVVPFCAVALLWDKIPAQVPTHWNARGKIDGHAGKAFGTLLMPFVNIFIAGLLGVVPLIDPKFRKYEAETGASVRQVLKIIRLVVTLFNACIALAILAFALHYHFDMTRFIVAASGLLFAILGNSMGKLRPNYFAGFRTPWTLESRTVWLKTHRLGGQTMVAGGICILFAAFLLPVPALFWWGFVPITLLTMLIPAVYSYFCYRAEKKNPEIAH